MASARGGTNYAGVLARLQRQLDQKIQMKVGIPKGATYPDGLYIAAIAAQNEFGGVITVPGHETTIYRSLGKNGEFRKNGRFVAKSSSNYATQAWVPTYTVNIPARPAWRQTVAEHKATWPGMFANFMKSTSYNVETSFARLGEVVVKQLRATIRAFDDPPNAPSTIRKKGKDNPLIQSGATISSLTFEVIK